MSKINVKGTIYDEVGIVKINNREYVFGLLNNDLSFFEKILGEEGPTYTMLNNDLTLAGNIGTSLTKLNERIVLSHLVDSIKKDIRLGKLKSIDDIKNELNLMQSVIDEEANIKKLLKGNVNDLDEDKFARNADSLVSYFDSKIRDKKRTSNDFDIIEGGVDRTFVNRNLYKELEEEKEAKSFADEELSPTFIVDKLEDVKPTIIKQELKKEEPSTSIMGINEAELTNEIIETILTKKKDQITPEQSLYLEKILESREPKKEEIETPIIKEEVSPFIESKEEVMQTVPETPVETITPVIEETKEEAHIEPVKGKQKTLKPQKNRKAAYVDTVILCLLTQLGIFGLLIFVLLLIK